MIIEGKRFKDFQVFKVKGHDEYIYAYLDSARMVKDYVAIDCCHPLIANGRYPNSHGTASRAYLYSDCYELSFAKLPKDIQDHLLQYVEGWNND